MTEPKVRDNDSQSNKENSYLPYETPKLRKYGRVFDVTKFITIGLSNDGIPPFSDAS
jgi:hypothetical protein